MPEPSQSWVYLTHGGWKAAALLLRWPWAAPGILSWTPVISSAGSICTWMHIVMSFAPQEPVSASLNPEICGSIILCCKLFLGGGDIIYVQQTLPAALGSGTEEFETTSLLQTLRLSPMPLDIRHLLATATSMSFAGEVCAVAM